MYIHTSVAISTKRGAGIGCDDCISHGQNRSINFLIFCHNFSSFGKAQLKFPYGFCISLFFELCGLWICIGGIIVVVFGVIGIGWGSIHDKLRADWEKRGMMRMSE